MFTRKIPAIRHFFLIMALALVLGLAGCAGKGPTLGRTQSPDAPALYAQAKDLYGKAYGEADVKIAVAAYEKAIRAGSPEAACDLAQLYLNVYVPVTPGKNETVQQTADKAAFRLFIQAANAGYAPAQ